MLTWAEKYANVGDAMKGRRAVRTRGVNQGVKAIEMGGSYDNHELLAIIYPGHHPEIADLELHLRNLGSVPFLMYLGPRYL